MKRTILAAALLAGYGPQPVCQRLYVLDALAPGTSGRLRRRSSPTERRLHVDITMAPNFVIDTGSHFALTLSYAGTGRQLRRRRRSIAWSIPMHAGASTFRRWSRLIVANRIWLLPAIPTVPLETSPMRLTSAHCRPRCLVACFAGVLLGFNGISNFFSGFGRPPGCTTRLHIAGGLDVPDLCSRAISSDLPVLYGRTVVPEQSATGNRSRSHDVLGGAGTDRRCRHPRSDLGLLRHVRAADMAAASQDFWLGVTRWPATASPWRSLMPRSHAASAANRLKI